MERAKVGRESARNEGRARRPLSLDRNLRTFLTASWMEPGSVLPRPRRPVRRAVGLCISFFVHSAFLFALAAALIKLEPLHSFFRRNLSGSKIQQFFPVTAHGAFESCPGRGDFTGKVMSIALCCKSASAIF